MNIEDIKCGDTFYECSYGENDEFVAVSDPYKKYVGQDNEGWAIKGRSTEDNSEIEFFAAERYGYGPHLYSEPQY